MRFFDIKIACPQMWGKIRTSQLRAVNLPNGDWIYSPFNGCDFSNGLPDCMYCQEKLLAYFMKQREELKHGIIYDPLKL